MYFSFKVLQPLYLTLFLLLPLSNLSGQEFPMRHYGIEDGLPSNTVYEIYRDSKGFLWFATDKGVARYNGLKFETFTTFDGLSDNEIFFFQEDFQGRLWMGTYNGSLCYYQNDMFHNAQNTAFLRLPFKASFIKAISIENDSSIIIRFFEHNAFINIKGNSFEIHSLKKINFTLYYNIDSLALDNIIDISKTLNGSYLVQSNYRSFLLDKNDNIITSNKNTHAEMLANGFCQNNIYYFDNSSVYSRDVKTKIHLPKNISSLYENNFFRKTPNLQRVFFDNDKAYFATSKELIICNNDSSVNVQSVILKGNSISSITKDNLGKYWISTLDSGVYQLDSNFDKSNFYRDIYKYKISYIVVRNNKIFFATSDNNVFLFNRSKNISLFNYNSYIDKLHTFNGNPSYFIDDNYRYYFCGFNKIIVVDNLLNHHLVPNVFTGGKLHIDFHNIIYSKNNFYAFLHRRNIIKFHFDYVNKKIKTSGVTDEISNDFRIFCICQDNDDNIWYSTIDRVYKIVDDIPQEQLQFKNISFKQFVFCGAYIVGYTHQNQLVVCSEINSPKIKIDSVRPQNCIWDKLYKIDSIHLLISTNNYYRIITLPSNKNKTYFISAIENLFIPLKANEICADSANCYFFKDGSVTSIDLPRLFKKSIPPKVFFTYIKADKNYNLDSNYNNIQLPFNSSRNITIDFSLISFDAKEITYQYSISKNNQDDWRSIKGEEINLINPGYGDYVIKVRVKSLSSEYSESATFNLHILRPFWATWWFIVLCFGGLGGIIFIIVRQRIRMTLKKDAQAHQSQVQFMKSEYKALNALMNPHFIFNTLNNVQSLVNNNDKLAANEYLRIFADLVRQNMHNVSKELISLQKEMELVSNYLMLEKLRFEDRLDYFITVDEDIDLSEIMIPPLLIQPLVENSIKHGIFPLKSRTGFVSVNIFSKDEILYIEIRDNGVGMVESSSHSSSRHESFGLSNIKKRIEQLSIIQNKEIKLDVSAIKDDAGNNQWTIVAISVPL